MHHAGRRATTVLLGALLTGLLAAAPATALTPAPGAAVVAPHPRTVAPAPSVSPAAATAPEPTVKRLPRSVFRMPLRLVDGRWIHRGPMPAR
ncbi:hypothetical protein [Kineococcus rubinsiae]|uniref:hypothetical protein n=1 Tax=Kineococcus rubinsiae TaxID=2609562 RepID=UPI0014310C4B|nr:hypothetical protein [Kineococcus rubinsiae]NIZ91624.1 hypothetical protein [Kineococcus rubinsiae]